MLAEVTPDVHACKKKGSPFSKEEKAREGSSRRLFGTAELAEQKALLHEVGIMLPGTVVAKVFAVAHARVCRRSEGPPCRWRV